MAARRSTCLRAPHPRPCSLRARLPLAAAGPGGAAAMSRPAAILLVLLAGTAYLLVLGPILIVVASAFSAADFFSFPPSGLSLRWFTSFFATPELRAAFALSLDLAPVAASTATVCGGLAAYFLARRQGWLASLAQGLFLAPLIFPSIILGLALLL